MTCKAAVLTGLALVAVLSAWPASAHETWRHGHSDHWRTTHAAIYAIENRVAFLEADPEIDDGYKAPIIVQGRADILELRATLHPAHWRWASPCCYSRRPIRIR
ncbi:MAG TPA: hypothetical protein VMV19_14900 [Xanthobacteraceae bacterium]|nr:hypothetical protein [Xanthobacteraceae bacterium]